MRLQFYSILFFIPWFFVSCNGGKSGDENSPDANPEVRAVNITRGSISKYVELNATSHFVKSGVVSSPIEGYILKAFAEKDRVVQKGDVLYTIQTREGRILDSGRSTDSLPGNFSGIDTISASAGGYIAETFHQEGDFVTTGEKLLALSETSSLVFVLDLPYEWNHLVSKGMRFNMILPDDSRQKGIVIQLSPQVDPANQTLKVLLSVPEPSKYPEGLIARVQIPETSEANTQLLPRAAVLANEQETEFWVMKLLNDSVAVKIPITPGIITRDTVEIVKPAFTDEDRILVYGNYAVPDTLKVHLTAPLP
jgi:multidrug efflux pump subunit AcrA (membrane-fusion protein)